LETQLRTQQDDEYRAPSLEQILALEARRTEIKGLCELSSHWNICFIACEWLSIGLVIFGAEKFFNPLTYVLAVVWIGSRLHALAILMHEAAHYRLLKNRKLNDFIGEVFLAWPITVTLRGYRNSHLAHHQHVNTVEDPDWEDGTKEDYRFPKTKMQMLYALLRNAFGFGFWDEFTDTAQSKEFNEVPRSLRITQLMFFATIVICSVIFSFWKLLLLYWLVPVTTSFIFVAYVRAIAEHYGIDNSHELRKSRSTIATFWESILLAPYNVGLHLDHHVHPGVPWYNLQKLHAVLLRDVVYADNAHVTKDGYFRGVLKECQQRS
jgi:fatty acid desaturase